MEGKGVLQEDYTNEMASNLSAVASFEENFVVKSYAEYLGLK